jgi:quercetin dioxygenase-like cupin family protein
MRFKKGFSTVIRYRYLPLIAVVAVTAAAGIAAVMTPGAGIVRAPVLARAGFVDPTDIKFKVKDGNSDVLHVPDADDTVVQEIVIAPGGHSGWHSHPGPVVILIKSGQMSFYDGDDPSCTVRTYSAGQAFIDSGQGHVHIARNEGSQDLEIWAVYFDVPPGQSFRTDVSPAPGNCTF